MLQHKKTINKLLGVAFAISAITAPLAHASAVVGGTLTPMITAGAPPDSPSAHVDPNLASSPFSGVVSINKGLIIKSAVVLVIVLLRFLMLSDFLPGVKLGSI